MGTKIDCLDEVWNIIAGCTHAGPGCAHCWAERMAYRLGRMGQMDYQELHQLYSPDWADLSQYHNQWNGTVRCLPHRLDIPLHWKRPRVVGVNFMADTFHEKVPDSFIEDVMRVIRNCPQHRFVVLTKRAKRMREFFRTQYRVLSEPPVPTNLAVGVSCSTQPDYEVLVSDLVHIPLACRILSLEPLLGPMDLLVTDVVSKKRLRIDYGGVAVYVPDPEMHPLKFISGVIVGGESGPGARPMHPDWVRGVRDQCAAANIPFYFKQWGNWVSPNQMTKTEWDRWVKGGPEWDDRPSDKPVHVGKKAAGHLLDGREHRELPPFFDLTSQG